MAPTQKTLHLSSVVTTFHLDHLSNLLTSCIPIDLYNCHYQDEQIEISNVPYLCHSFLQIVDRWILRRSFWCRRRNFSVQRRNSRRCRLRLWLLFHPSLPQGPLPWRRPVESCWSASVKVEQSRQSWGSQCGRALLGVRWVPCWESVLPSGCRTCCVVSPGTAWYRSNLELNACG